MASYQPARSFSLENESFVLTSKEIMDAIGFDCGVCIEPFTLYDRPPKSLPCNHTFCQQCLMKLTPDYNDIVHCPTCRRGVDHDSLDDLPTDHRIVRGIEAITKAKERFKNVCFKHNCQPLDHFCTKCDEATCSDCSLFCHRETDGHNVVELSEELQENHSKRFEELEKRSEENVRKMKTKGDMLSNIKHSLEATVSQEIDKVETAFGRYTQLMEERKEQLIKMIEDKIQKRTSEIANESLQHLEKMKNLQDSSERFRASRQSGDLRAIYKWEKALMEQEKNTIDSDENALCVNYEFKPAHEESFLIELNRLGDVSGKFDGDLKSPSASA